MSWLGKTSSVSIAIGIVGNFYAARFCEIDTLSRFPVAVDALVSDVPLWFHVLREVILGLLLAGDALVIVSPSNIHIRCRVIDFIVSEGTSNELEVTGRVEDRIRGII